MAIFPNLLLKLAVINLHMIQTLENWTTTRLTIGSSGTLRVSYKPYFEEDDDVDDSTNDNTDDNTNNTIVSCYQNEDCLDGEILNPYLRRKN